MHVLRNERAVTRLIDHQFESDSKELEALDMKINKKREEKDKNLNFMSFSKDTNNSEG